jgi:hypothetical protein
VIKLEKPVISSAECMKMHQLVGSSMNSACMVQVFDWYVSMYVIMNSCLALQFLSNLQTRLWFLAFLPLLCGIYCKNMQLHPLGKRLPKKNCCVMQCNTGPFWIAAYIVSLYWILIVPPLAGHVFVCTHQPDPKTVHNKKLKTK